jgi:hypothetical protein
MIHEALITGTGSVVGSSRFKENSQANHTVTSIRQRTLGSLGLTKFQLGINFYKLKCHFNQAE